MYCQFSWDDEDEPEYCVAFCYELQVDVKYRKLGLGRELMNVLQRISSHWKMKKTVPPFYFDSDCNLSFCFPDVNMFQGERRRYAFLLQLRLSNR